MKPYRIPEYPAVVPRPVYDDVPVRIPIVLLVVIILILVSILLFIPPIPPPVRRRGGRSLRLEENRNELPISNTAARSAVSGPAIQSNRTPDSSLDRWGPAFDRSTENIARLQRALATSTARNADLVRQLEDQSRELEGARILLTTADAVADTEVIQLLGKLNAELQLASTIMAEHVEGTFKLDHGFMTSDSDWQAVVDRASESIGSTLVQSFRTVRPDDFPMHLQIALQACLTRSLFWVVSSWTLDQTLNTFIDETYQRLRKTEKQAMSAHWRSIMHTHALPTCVSEPGAFVTPILAGLSDVLFAAGCAASRSDIISELSTFESKILAIVLIAGRLNKMITGVISGDFEVYIAQPGEAFDEGTMEEDTDGSRSEAAIETGSAKIVLCTNELGLTKRLQQGTGEGAVTKTVVRAKVILESFLETGH